MTIIVRSYTRYSAGAKALAQAIGGRRVWAPEYNVRKFGDIVLNWGNKKVFDWRLRMSYNPPQNIALVSDKVKAFSLFNQLEVPTLDWTTDKAVAQSWFDDGKLVVARTITNGHSGQGIVLCGPDENPALVNAPLYTLYKKKKREFRVHSVAGKHTLVVEKRKRRGVAADAKIRNHANGYVFCADDIEDGFKTRLAELVKPLHAKLDYFAADVIYNEREDKFYVLEVNTAPGLEGRTLEFYTDAFKMEYL